MEFRPCIDIHDGKVKQIVGGSLKDSGTGVKENFISDRDAAFFADLYRREGLKGGHVILLNSRESAMYEETRRQAITALKAYPSGLQVGGGIIPENAMDFLDAGASHVIVTSYVFQGGKIRYDRLKEMIGKVGREHLVLDMSCRRTKEGYRVVTDRWQKITDEIVNRELLEDLGEFCDEFLVHAVDVEGRTSGIEEEIIKILSEYDRRPVTYAGGIRGIEDIERIRELGKNRIHFTIGSALDLFGGTLSWEKVLTSVK